MSKILQGHAYIVNANTHEHVYDLGAWKFGVCVDTGISTANTDRIAESSYDFFTGLVDNVISFGGDVQITERLSAKAATVAQYVPLTTGIIIPTEYANANYGLQIENTSNYVAYKMLTETTGNAGMSLLNKSTFLTAGGTAPISHNSFSISGNNVSWTGLVVSGFENDKFTDNMTYYGVTVQDNRYWNRNDITISINAASIEYLNSFDTFDPLDDDPYANGGDSDTGGGSGNFDGSGDSVGHPNAPTLSAVDTGFITLFNPSVAQLNALANYMWSSGFDLETFKKIFADPMDCILGLSIVPVNVPSAGASEVKVGNISTGVSMTKASSQYVTVDCGSLNVNEYWGAYLDYAPYTKAELYLPYIGTHAINIDDIMGKTVSIQYIVDILSGACNATVKCGSAVLYEFIGHCAASIPISGNDWTNVINGVLQVAGSIGSMVATSGLTAPLAAGTIASAAVNDSKPTVEKSGSLSGTGSMLGIQTPYLMLTRPRQAKPKKQNAFLGYPAFITAKLEDIDGYAEFEEVHLQEVHATLEETREIEALLKSGVIL